MITATAVGLLLVGLASFMIGLWSARGRAWIDALIEILAGVLLVLCAFGVLP